MPDITMCKGGNCPVKKKCYRHNAKAGTMQSWFMEPPYKDGKCEHFIRIRPESLVDKSKNARITKMLGQCAKVCPQCHATFIARDYGCVPKVYCSKDCQKRYKRLQDWLK